MILSTLSRAHKTELVRKALHLLVAFTVPLAGWNRGVCLTLLSGGTLFYCGAETLRTRGRSIPLVSRLTRIASRSRDEGHFVLGPVTLGLGALGGILCFPPAIAAAAVYALAFGDTAASIGGSLFGVFRPRFLRGKSVEGTLASFVTVYTVVWALRFGVIPALAAALLSVVVDILPMGDYDNLALPLAIGLALRLYCEYAP
ncbi:MAG: phosphatidate cytidylyltransferase [Treponema sp.]|nr:phosphatidate cytidylyltransferase [Treponema sp.]